MAALVLDRVQSLLKQYGIDFQVTRPWHFGEHAVC